MDTMNDPRRKTIRHYPADRLPDDLRGEWDASGKLTVTLVREDDTDQISAEVRPVPKYLRFWGAAAHHRTSIEDAVARVRELREEWD